MSIWEMDVLPIQEWISLRLFRSTAQLRRDDTIASQGLSEPGHRDFNSFSKPTKCSEYFLLLDGKASRVNLRAPGGYRDSKQLQQTYAELVREYNDRWRNLNSISKSTRISFLFLLIYKAADGVQDEVTGPQPVRAQEHQQLQQTYEELVHNYIARWRN